MVVLGLVESTAFTGTPSKSPIRFNHNSISSTTLNVNGEEYYFTDMKMDVNQHMYYCVFRHLLNIRNSKGKVPNITLNEFTKYGLFLLQLQYYNNKGDRNQLEKEGIVKVQVQNRNNQYIKCRCI